MVRRLLTRTALAGLLIALGSMGGAAAQSIPIEGNAIISDTKDFPRSKLLKLVEPGVGMIRAMGWRCDSLSAIRPHIFSVGFTMVCNGFRYEYEFSDRGGNWIVELQ